MHMGCSENFVLPVCAFAENRHIGEFLGGAEAHHLGTEVTVGGELAQVHYIEAVGDVLDSVISFIAEFCFSCFTTPGSDHDHAVACA